jgi:hypothetical protein
MEYTVEPFIHIQHTLEEQLLLKKLYLLDTQPQLLIELRIIWSQLLIELRIIRSQFRR